MPSKQRRLDLQTNNKTSAYRTPEEEELERKRIELEQLESDVADLELELATIRSELVVFERNYMEAVGSRYAELDRLEAQIADFIAQSHPKDPSARKHADATRTRRESEEALGEHGRKGPAPEFEPTEELKRLYRQAAMELHPDLTTDDDEKPRRQRAMAEVNEAYEKCDAERIKKILDEWRSSPEHVQGDDMAAQLVRAIRRIALAIDPCLAIDPYFFLLKRIFLTVHTLFT